MVYRADVYDALTGDWRTTQEVADKVPRTARTERGHQQQVYRALRRLAEDGQAEYEPSWGGSAWWRKV